MQIRKLITKSNEKRKAQKWKREKCEVKQTELADDRASQTIWLKQLCLIAINAKASVLGARTSLAEQCREEC